MDDEELVNHALYIMENQKINTNIADKLSFVEINNKTAYNWYSIIKNDPGYELLNRISIDCQNFSSTFESLQYVINNLEHYLQFCKTNVGYIDLPLEKNETLKIEPSKLIDKFQSHFVRNNNINIVKYFPIIENPYTNIIHNVLQMSKQEIWYVVDMLPFPHQRTILYNCLNVYGIKPEFDKKSKYDTTEYIAGQIIESLPSNINFDAINTLSNKIIIDESDLGQFIHKCLLFYFKLRSETQKVRESELKEFEDKIIDEFKQINIFRSDDSEETMHYDFGDPEISLLNLYSLPEKKTPETILCDPQIAPSTIMKVLSIYPKIHTLNTTINIFRPICPIQVKYIFSTFQLYDQKMIAVENNNIIVKDFKAPLVDNDLQKFSHLKNLVSFNNDYNYFKTIIEETTCSDDELAALIPKLYNSTSFRESTILAELLNFNFNFQLPSKNMYTLLSKLTDEQLETLDGKFDIMIMDPKKQLLNLLLSTSTPYHNSKLDTLYKNLLNNITMVPSYGGKINETSSIHLNIVQLSKLLNSPDINKNSITSLKLLMLYSNASAGLKNIIYKDLGIIINKCEFGKIKNNDTTVAITKNIDYKSIYELYYKYLGYDLSNTFPDLVNYIKHTKDIKFVNYIKNYYKEHENPS